MFILHLFEEVDETHLDLLDTLSELMELLPLSAHKLSARVTDEHLEMLGIWHIMPPNHFPVLVVLNYNTHLIVYPDLYDTQEQLIAVVLDFFGIEY